MRTLSFVIRLSFALSSGALLLPSLRGRGLGDLPQELLVGLGRPDLVGEQLERGARLLLEKETLGEAELDKLREALTAPSGAQSDKGIRASAA